MRKTGSLGWWEPSNHGKVAVERFLAGVVQKFRFLPIDCASVEGALLVHRVLQSIDQLEETILILSLLVLVSFISPSLVERRFQIFLRKMIDSLSS